MRFDWIGFGVLSVGIGGLQLMMDRGQVQDWFSSTEVITEATIGGLGVYLFIVHMATAKEPFIPTALFKDRNFATGLALMFVAGTILVSSSSLMAPWLQNLANYPVETAGLIMAPRGVGTMMAMMTGGRLVGRLDPRKVMAAGIVMLSWSTWEMTSWTPISRKRRSSRRSWCRALGLGSRSCRAGASVRDLIAAIPDRRHIAVQSFTQHWGGGRRVGHIVVAGTQHASATRVGWCVGYPVQSSPSGRRDDKSERGIRCTPMVLR